MTLQQAKQKLTLAGKMAIITILALANVAYLCIHAFRRSFTFRTIVNVVLLAHCLLTFWLHTDKQSSVFTKNINFNQNSLQFVALDSLSFVHVQGK